MLKVTGRRTIAEGKFLRIVAKDVSGGDGRKGIWETVERTNVHGSGAVVVIPLTKDRELLFEKNWRAPIESWVIQFPAGLTDVANESEEDAARRELLEETGYAAGELIPIFLSPLSAGVTATRAMHYFAPDVEFVARPRSKDIEEIEVVKVPVDHADEFMMNLPEGVELDLQVPGILWMMRAKGLI